MSQKIAVIDYGMGNLRSVAKAIEHVAENVEVSITNDHKYIRQADRVVFPGQGAARDCMSSIDRFDLKETIVEVSKNKPFLGICMGQQILMTASDENQGVNLLGIFYGKVKRFDKFVKDNKNNNLKVPHMGWNQVAFKRDHPLWRGIENQSRFYFVHSYRVVPEDPSLIIATTDYGVRFTSAIAKDNLFATQFHPEKSSRDGLQFLKNFLDWKP